MSTTRIRSRSNVPPKYPAVSPTGTPIASTRAAVATPTLIDTRAPYMRRLSTSRPSARQEHRVIAAGRGRHEVPADPRHPGDRLDKERSGDHVGHEDAGDGRNRHERVAEGVPDDDPPTREPLRAGRPNVVLSEDVQQRPA